MKFYDFINHILVLKLFLQAIFWARSARAAFFPVTIAPYASYGSYIRFLCYIMLASTRIGWIWNEEMDKVLNKKNKWQRIMENLSCPAEDAQMHSHLSIRISSLTLLIHTNILYPITHKAKSTDNYSNLRFSHSYFATLISLILIHSVSLAEREISEHVCS